MWSLVLVMTVGLLFFPVEVHYGLRTTPAGPFHPVTHQTAAFGVLLSSLTALVLAGLFLYGGERREWPVLVGLCLFAAAFSGWHVLVSRSFVGDVFMPLSDVRRILSQGRIGPIEDLRYGGYPGLAILASMLGTVTGSQFPASSMTFVAVQMIGFVLVLYALFRALLGDIVTAALGVLIAIEGNQAVAVLISSFHPGAFAPLVLFSACLLTFHLPPGRSRLLLYGGFLVAITVTHLATAIVLLLSTAGRAVLMRAKQNAREATFTFAVSLVVVLAWQAFQVPSMIKRLATDAEIAFREVLIHRRLQDWFPGSETLFVDEVHPPWSVFIQYFWPVMLGLVPSVITLDRLRRRGSIRKSDELELAGMVGVWGLSAAAFAVGGLSNAVIRGLAYVGFFGIPLLMTSIARPLRRGAALSAIVLATLASPSYAFYFRGVPGWIYYPAEIAGGEFLGRAFGQGDGVKLFGIADASYYLIYFLPRAEHAETYYHVIKAQGRGDTWTALETYGKAFLNRPDEKISVMDFSIRWVGVLPTGTDAQQSQRWGGLRKQLSAVEAVYENGMATYFTFRQ
jgi:hypothetical protein